MSQGEKRASCPQGPCRWALQFQAGLCVQGSKASKNCQETPLELLDGAREAPTSSLVPQRWERDWRPLALTPAAEGFCLTWSGVLTAPAPWSGLLCGQAS